MQFARPGGFAGDADGVAEQAKGCGLPWEVTEPGRGVERDLLGRDPVLHVGTAAEEVRHRPGKLPATAIGDARGEGDHGEQHAVLGLEPGHRLPVTGDRLGDHAGRWGIQGQGHLGWLDHQRRRVRGMQVVVEESVGGMPRLVRAAASQVDGVGAEQVVQGVTSMRVLGDQVSACERVHVPVGGGLVGGGQAGRGWHADVGSRVQAEQPEQPCGVRSELVVGPGEDGADAGGRVGRVEGI